MLPDFQLAQQTFAELKLPAEDELRARREYAALITELAYAGEKSATK